MFFVYGMLLLKVTIVACIWRTGNVLERMQGFPEAL